MQIYQKKQLTSQATPSAVPAVPSSTPSLDALRAGTAQPTSDMLGHKVDLPGQMQAKMESAFGADLSSVQLYESQAVADAGAQAITQGNRIAFAPGQLDFTSMQGQALLGHELSHVVSQVRGEVSGGGFLNDHALEARADREGFLAAQGQSVSGGVTAPLSSVSAASAAGPMQAKKHGNRNEGLRSQRQDLDQSDTAADTEGANLAFLPETTEAQKALKTQQISEHYNQQRNTLKSQLEVIDQDATLQSRFGTLSPMLRFLNENPDIAISSGGAATGTVQDGKAGISLNLGSTKRHGLLRAQMLHEATHLRNAVAGHNALSNDSFSFRDGARMQHNGQDVNTMTDGNYGKRINEPRSVSGAEEAITGTLIQREIMGTNEGSDKKFGADFLKHMKKAKGADRERVQAVSEELKRIGGNNPLLGIAKTITDQENLAEPTAYLNQMLYLIYENRDLFKDSMYETKGFKALQHYTGALNNTDNYVANGEGDSATLGVRGLTSYAASRRRR